MADYSLLFDGANDKAQIADDAALDGLVAATIELFFKTGYDAGYQKILRKDGAIDLGISQNFGGGAKIFCEIVGVGNLGELDGIWTDDEYHHLAIVWDDTILKAYIDGVLKKTGTASGAAQGSGSSPLYIGHSNGSEFFNGYVDEFRLSDIVRYTSDFTPPTAEFEDDANTILLIHCNDGSGATATDSSGNAHPIDLDGTNPPTWSLTTPGLTSGGGGGGATLDKVFGIAKANIAKINDVAIGSISKFLGVAVS